MLQPEYMILMGNVTARVPDPDGQCYSPTTCFCWAMLQPEYMILMRQYFSPTTENCTACLCWAMLQPEYMSLMGNVTARVHDPDGQCYSPST
jgi:hypothetical protein